MNLSNFIADSSHSTLERISLVYCKSIYKMTPLFKTKYYLFMASLLYHPMENILQGRQENMWVLI